MKKIENDKVILRDFIENDIQNRIIWETEETEWQLWDAPWEFDAKTKKESASELEHYISTMKSWVDIFKNKPVEEVRSTFQVIEKNENKNYIGWVNSYKINDNYEFSKDGKFVAIGIDIPAMSARGKGYASYALLLFINYLFENCINDIYTQTWSGNERMIGLASKLGFEECMRKSGIRMVGGKRYDALTFRLNHEKFRQYCNHMKQI